MIAILLCVVFLNIEARYFGNYELNILHYNDFHARFVETSLTGRNCNSTAAPCIGGFARLTTAIRQGLQREPSSLVLSGGDSFQGTIWYNLLRWNVTQEFMNMIPHDAHVLGNHEFDNGIAGVVPYLKHLEAPVVTANIVDDDEPSIQGLYKHSVVVEKNGRKIGIIGVLLSDTINKASTGRLRFTDEVEAVKYEAEKLNRQGVTIIVVLSHCGLIIDREIALNSGPYIDIIVGGHSHSLLYNGAPPESTKFVPEGPYPMVVKQQERPVLIVQAAANSEFLGEIKLYFDDVGNLLHWNGHPHYLGHDIEQAQDVLEKVNKYLPVVEELANVEIGTSLIELSSDCFCQECNLGNLICDAYLNKAKQYAKDGHWNPAHFCAINRGNIRASIAAGVITYESVIVAQPFENNVEVFDLRGDHVLEMLEHGVANVPWPGSRMLQMVSKNRKNDVLTKYIKKQTPINVEVDGRIQITDPCIRN